MTKRLVATGIVVEYNPFHNGHIHHIKEARKITNCDILIAVMSPNFVQRGEPSYIDKWTRTKIALEYGVDIVIELPTYYTLQAAQVFASTSVNILDQMQVNSIVFGSESNDLLELKPSTFDKDKISSGLSYAASFNSQIGPNDILGIEYLKAITKTTITPYAIQRTNAYHDLSIDNPISSASSIRKAHAQGDVYNHTTPLDLTKKITHVWNDYTTLLQYQLRVLSTDYLQSLLLVDEGIENLFKKFSLESAENIIQNSISKRYTRSRVQRTLAHILLNISKEEPDFHNFRILGFTKKGSLYLKQYKESNEIIPYTTQFKTYSLKDMEYRVTSIYTLPKDISYQKEQLQKEISGPILSD